MKYILLLIFPFFFPFYVQAKIHEKIELNLPYVTPGLRNYLKRYMNPDPSAPKDIEEMHATRGTPPPPLPPLKKEECIPLLGQSPEKNVTALTFYYPIFIKRNPFCAYLIEKYALKEEILPRFKEETTFLLWRKEKIEHCESCPKTTKEFAQYCVNTTYIVDFIFTHGDKKLREELVHAVLNQLLPTLGIFSRFIPIKEYYAIAQPLYAQYYWPLLVAEPSFIKYLTHYTAFHLQSPWVSQTSKEKKYKWGTYLANMKKWIIYQTPHASLSVEDRQRWLSTLYDLYIGQCSYRHAIGILHYCSPREFDSPTTQRLVYDLMECLYKERAAAEYNHYLSILQKHYEQIGRPMRFIPFPSQTTKKK